MCTILFVCTGNTCRSSMAAALARKYLQERGALGKWQVTSAGLAAAEGAPPTPEAVDAVAELGADLTGHRARRLTPEMVEQADLILTMTREHNQAVLRQVPQAEGKVYTLKEFARGLDARELEKQLLEKTAALAAVEREFTSKYERDRERLARLQEEPASRQAHLAEQEAAFNRATAEVRDEIARLSRALAELDIPDPIGSSREDYQECAQELQRQITRALERYLG